LPITTITKDGDRWYVNTSTRDEVPGVSAIVSMYPKGKLTDAAARVAAEYVIEKHDKLPALIKSDKRKAIDLIRGAHTREWDKKAKAGTLVHTYVEVVNRALIRGEKPRAERVPSEVLPFLKNYVRFIQEFGMEPVLIERVIWDTQVGYAGRLDLAARLTAIDKDEIAIIDTKSGASGVYESVSLQQTAYAYAEFMWDEEQDKLVPMPEIGATYALWLRPEGYALIPVDSTDMEWEQFKLLRKSLDWKRQRAKYVIRPAINKKPIKRQRRW
jgi:hypothetical protein